MTFRYCADLIEAAPGIVHHRSPQDAKVAFFGALCPFVLADQPA